MNILNEYLTTFPNYKRLVGEYIYMEILLYKEYTSSGTIKIVEHYINPDGFDILIDENKKVFFGESLKDYGRLATEKEIKKYKKRNPANNSFELHRKS